MGKRVSVDSVMDALFEESIEVSTWDVLRICRKANSVEEAVEACKNKQKKRTDPDLEDYERYMSLYRSAKDLASCRAEVGESHGDFMRLITDDPYENAKEEQFYTDKISALREQAIEYIAGAKRWMASDAVGNLPTFPV